MVSARRFLLCELALLAGVALASLHAIPPWTALLAAGVSIPLLATRIHFGWALLPIFLSIGMVRMGFEMPPSGPHHIVALAGSTAVFTGVVDAEVDRRLDGQRLTVAAQQSNGQPLEGRLLVRVGLYPPYAYGDVVEVRCTLERPAPVEDFAYDAYLALSDIFTVCAFPSVTLLGHDGGAFVLGHILPLKEYFLERVGRLFHEPQAALLGGLLVGARRGIPPDLLDAFRTVGLTHIIALSGFNITILAAALFAASIGAGLHRRTAFFVVLAILAVFVLLTGASASVVRASIMGCLVLLARHLGRPSNAWYALTFAATLMVLVHPRILLTDVGFQLSFLATLGLFTITPWLSGRLRLIPSALGMRETVAATLGATVATFPLLLHTFSRVSIVGLLANILVVPVIPFTMLLGFLAVALPGIGVVLGAAAWLCLTWMVTVAETLARVRFASVELPAVPLWGALLVYLAVGLAAFLLVRRSRPSPEPTP